MQPFGFNVVSGNREEGTPIAIAGQVMVDIQNLLTDIGRCIVRSEMWLQNEIPPEIIDKFTLRIGGSSKKGLGSNVSKGSEALMEDALKVLFETLNYLGRGASAIWMQDKFNDPFERSAIARDLVALNDHLGGNILIYGPTNDQREFRGLDRDKILQFVKSGAEKWAVIGKVSSDPRYKGHWNLVNSENPVPLSFSKRAPKNLVDRAAGSGIVSVVGFVSRNADGKVLSINNVESFIEYSEAVFYRIITPERVVPLGAPLKVKVSYSAGTGMWTMAHGDLGIDVSKPSWDECVIALHKQFVLHYESYVETEKEFTGADKEAKALFLTYLPS